MSDSEFPSLSFTTPEEIGGTTEEGPACEQPVARFFGVPFQKGLAREITAIHLCPSRVHLATIRDGSELDVYNRLTYQRLDLGERARARMVAFRPQTENN
jgi:hypothetical protein